MLARTAGSPSPIPPHEELPAARSATGFAFSPAPRRGTPVTGSSLLGAPLPLPNGSPLANMLATTPPSSTTPVSTSPLGRPPLAPGSHQLVQQAQQVQQQQAQQQQQAAQQQQQEPEVSVGASEAVQRAIAALEAAALGKEEPPASEDQAAQQGASDAAAAEAQVEPSGAAPSAGLHPSRSYSGSGDETGPSGSGEGGVGSWRQERQLGGHRRRSPSVRGRRQKGMFGESYPSPWRDPRLFICASGQGSPCLDLRRVSREVADAASGVDLGERRRAAGEQRARGAEGAQHGTACCTWAGPGLL